MKITIDNGRDYSCASTEMELYHDEKRVAQHLIIQNKGQYQFHDELDTRVTENTTKKDGNDFTQIIITISRFDEMNPTTFEYEEAEKLLNAAIRKFREKIVFILDVQKAMNVIKKLEEK